MAAPTGYVDPNFPNPMGPHDARIIIYGYTPSFALCIIAIVLFAICFIVHAIQVWIYKTWSFSPLTFACLMEVIGYAFRSLSSRKNPYNVIYFVVQYFLVVTAPVFISASIYVCLTKLIHWASSHDSLPNVSIFRKPKWILWIFITADVLSTILQIAGAALIGSAESNGKDPTTANNILLAGLVCQTFFFSIFLILLAIFIVRLPSVKSYTGIAQFLAALSLASVLVYIRTIFRLAETATGVLSYLSTHEAFFGALEFAPMVLAVLLLAIWHPGRAIPRNGAMQDSRRKSSAV
ncbi:Sphingoid long-chain base transporter RSB1-like protein 7 [Phlyctema vagabunda]|uniref:Sphingoid long-chain base transporter RSB1-like protein 7 n=1 Tax=Phlyctema vagabunda TaxID=108571 RepID=A0ABR4PQZ0_9HELO